MNFNDFPSLVKEKVLQYIISENSVCLSKWKNCLPLMAVSHEWRELSKRHVYKTAYIEYCKKMPNRNNASKSCNLKTNIDLIISTNNSHYVKKVDIFLREYKLTPASLLELTKLFAFHRIQWKQVEYIRSEMYFDYDTRTTNNDFEYEFGECPALEKSMGIFAANILRNMPNVSWFKHNSHKNDHVAKVFINKLVNAYSNNLKRLQCYPEVTFTAPSMSDKLEYLNVHPNTSQNKHIPSIYASSITKLVLGNLSSEFSWKMFKDTNYKTKIVFNKLHSLELGFQKIMDDIELASMRLDSIKMSGTDQYDVSMPILKNLIINGNPIMPEMLSCVKLPLVLDSVTVVDSLDNLALCTQLNTKSIGRLKAILNLDTFDSPERFYQITNSLFGKHGICKRATVELRNIPFAIDPDCLDWENVTELTIGYVIDYSKLTYLLSKLPNLTDLVVSQFTSNGVTIDMIDIDENADYNEPINVLNPSLKSVWFMNIAEGSSYDIAALCIQHLLTLLPVVSNIRSFYNQGRLMREFILDYRNLYPHLTNINVVG